jgi:acyl carrier protein
MGRKMKAKPFRIRDYDVARYSMEVYVVRPLPKFVRRSPPSPSRQTKMKELILDFLGKRASEGAKVPVDLDTHLFESGILDSFGLVDLVTLLESETGLSITDDDLNDPRFTSVAGIVAIMTRKQAAS